MENKEQQNLPQNERLNLLQEAITDLFDCYDGPDRIEEFLWDQMVTAMGSSRSNNWSPVERMDALNFYKFMWKVAKAAYPLYKKRNQVADQLSK